MFVLLLLKLLKHFTTCKAGTRFPGVVIFSLDGSKGNYTYTEMQNFAQTRQGKSPAAAEIVKSDQCSRL